LIYIGIQGRAYFDTYYLPRNSSSKYLDFKSGGIQTIYTFGFNPSISLYYAMSKHLSVFTHIGAYIYLKFKPLGIIPQGNVGVSFGFYIEREPKLEKPM
jgi:hypothetical protein